VDGTPGADDNAPGAAVMLESARVLAQYAFARDVLFCAFNLEELNMIGSSEVVAALKSAGTGVRGMIALKMIGYIDDRRGSQRYPAGLGVLYPDCANFIGIVGNWKSRPLLREIASAMRKIPALQVETLTVPGNGNLLPVVRLSDHAPFWDAGYGR
jgi:Zn-dependent M28 family amino/carboxypeptidase